MPFRGVVFVLAVAVVLGIACRKEMYAWFKNTFYGHDEPEDEE